MENIEVKNNSGQIIEVKKIERNGVPIGIVKGYIATWDLDQLKDKFIPGAFSEHLDEYRKSGKQIKLKDDHQQIIGGYPIENVREDSKGLYGEGEINLDVNSGREKYALAKQGVLTDFSIGYRAIEKKFVNGERHIYKSKVFEGSIVDRPANIESVITEVKTVDELEDIEDKIKYCITDLKNISKSEMVKIFRSAKLSKSAADYVTSIVMTDNLVNDSGNPVKMMNVLLEQMKNIKETF